MPGALTDLIDGLLKSSPDLNVDELCEVIWLARQASRWDDFPCRELTARPPALAEPKPLALPDHQHASARRPGRAPGQLSDRSGGPLSKPKRKAADRPGRVAVYGAGQLDGAGEGRTMSAVRIRVPDAPALPQARKLSQALRPLRYGQRRTSRASGIDEEATALLIAESGIRTLAYNSTRRRRFDLDLVLDLGGSGPLWARLADDLRVMLEGNGTFRSVRAWALDSDAPGIPLRPGHAVAGLGKLPAVRPGVVCALPRNPIVVVLTDGAGRGWQTRQAHGLLREWAVHGTLLLGHLLPAEMWNRTAVRAVPVTFRPAADGYHRAATIEVSATQLSAANVSRPQLPATTAVPVISIDPAGVRSWLPLLRGSEAGRVPGGALLIPPASPAGGGDATTGTSEPRDEELASGIISGERRVRRFTLTASGDALRLAQLLSVFSAVTVPAIRKVRHELLPHSSPVVMAEVMLGGLFTWPPATAIESLSGATAMDFHPEVRDLLMRRSGGVAEFNRDHELVRAALMRETGDGTREDLLAVSAGAGTEPVTVAPTIRPLIEPFSGTWDWRPSTSTGWADEGSPVKGGEGDRGRRGRAVKTLKIGLWGSTQSGRTVFLTVLGHLGLEKEGKAPEWATWRGEKWRLAPDDDVTMRYIENKAHRLFDRGSFLEGTLPANGTALSFTLERWRPRGVIRRERKIQISMPLIDAAGIDFRIDRSHPVAVEYLKTSDALLYFFDPTYDLRSPTDPLSKFKSFDYFDSMVLNLRMSAVNRNRLHRGVLSQHIAVVVPKLDDQWIFDIANRHQCIELEPQSGFPWVPPDKGRRFFESLTYQLGTPDADYLRRELGSAFHPKRISYHALSSVGFYLPDPDHPEFLNRRDVCNGLTAREQTGDEPPSASWVRGTIRPVHAIDPLIALAERALAESGHRR